MFPLTRGGHVTPEHVITVSEMATRSDKRRKTIERPAHDGTALYHWAINILGNDTHIRLPSVRRSCSPLERLYRAGEIDHSPDAL